MLLCRQLLLSGHLLVKNLAWFLEIPHSYPLKGVRSISGLFGGFSYFRPNTNSVPGGISKICPVFIKCNVILIFVDAEKRPDPPTSFSGSPRVAVGKCSVFASLILLISWSMSSIVSNRLVGSFSIAFKMTDSIRLETPLLTDRGGRTFSLRCFIVIASGLWASKGS